jgi:lipoprotein-anchoring transpeptidase ErfK/SrfK
MPIGGAVALGAVVAAFLAAGAAGAAPAGAPVASERSGPTGSIIVLAPTGTTGGESVTPTGTTGTTGSTGTTGLSGIKKPTGPAPGRIVGPPPSAWTSLSNESTTTRWAYVSWAAPIRSSPVLRAAVVGSLHLVTEELTPAVYEVLSRWVDPQHRAWLRVRVPLVRSASLRGWVPQGSLGPLHTDHTALQIDTTALRATLYGNGHVIWTAPVGIGKPGTITPHGHFYIREGLRLGAATGLYGVYAFGTSAYSATLTDWPGGGVIGIHGTNQPQLVPGRPSHGCVRVRNPDMLRLSRLMPLGTPVWIY